MPTFEEFQSIELEYDVGSIKAKGIQIWPILRSYIAAEFIIERNTEIKVSKTNLIPLIRSFFYGLSLYFKCYDFLFFSASEQKRKINGIYIDRCDITAELMNKTLILENLNSPSHAIKSDLQNKFVASKLPFALLTRLIAFFLPKPVIENEYLLDEILIRLNLSKNLVGLIKRFFAEKYVMKRFIKWKKLKGLFLYTSYTNFGSVYAFNEANLPVVEFQHGVIIKSHMSYNINRDYGRMYYPKYLLTYGEKEKNVFDSENFFIDQKNVFPMGNYILDYVKENAKSNEKFEMMFNKYDKIIAFAAQDWFENQYIPVLKEIAKIRGNYGFIIIPRNQSPEHYSKYNLEQNIHFVPWLSTYEIINFSDFHSTIYSTTVYEATALYKPSVLLNINGISKHHILGDFPEENEIVFYVDTAEEFVDILDNYHADSERQLFEKYNIFKPGFIENLEEFISKNLQF